ncbi:PEGA domain-containing protein [bacterium]|nr:MAG: PEGA domain-containing protein [bacterium]
MTNMKGKLTLLLILVLLFVAFVVVRFFIFDKQNEYGKLKIISSPTASIFINSTLIGKTPFEDKYKVGEYLLKLIPETTASDTASWNGKIIVYKNSLTYVNRELGSSDIASAGEIFTTSKMTKAPQNAGTGEIYVETEPQGAIVTLDSDEKGVAPALMENVTTGDHELSVFMPGFFRRTQKVNVDAGYRVNASFKLAIDQSQKTADQTISTTNASSSANLTGKTKITIKDTPTGWLRVREEPSLNASESGRVNPGESFDLLDEQDGWYKISVSGKNGWVSSQYSTKQ